MHAPRRLQHPLGPSSHCWTELFRLEDLSSLPIGHHRHESFATGSPPRLPLRPRLRSSDADAVCMLYGYRGSYYYYRWWRRPGSPLREIGIWCTVVHAARRRRRKVPRHAPSAVPSTSSDCCSPLYVRLAVCRRWSSPRHRALVDSLIKTTSYHLQSLPIAEPGYHFKLPENRASQPPVSASPRREIGYSHLSRFPSCFILRLEHFSLPTTASDYACVGAAERPEVF